MMYRTYEIDERYEPETDTSEFVVFAPPDHMEEVGRFGTEAQAREFIDKRMGNRRMYWRLLSGTSTETHTCHDSTNRKELGRIVQKGITPNGFTFIWSVSNGTSGKRAERRVDAKILVEREIIRAGLLK